MWSLVGALLLSVSTQALDGRAVATVPNSLMSYATRPVLASDVSANTTPDPVAKQAITGMLNELKQLGLTNPDQGAWIQSHDGAIASGYLSNRPLPSASLTKIVTTLAALQAWGSNYRFITNISTTGNLVGDTLKGDLIIEGGGDPFFVWEEAIAVGNKLNKLGLKRIQGNLVITGRFAMNFETDLPKAASFLRLAFDSSRWDGEVAEQYATMPVGTPKPQLTILGNVQTVANLGSSNISSKLLIRHASLPLWQILKRMNTFSNNEMSEMLASQLGGGQQVAAIAANATDMPLSEIRLVNGSGLGQANQISPRAVVAILMAVHNRAQVEGLTLADLFPMSDCNCGTIEGRKMPRWAIVKTGTLSDVSALAGVIQTKQHGVIWFSLINRGEGNIDDFHRSQDQVLQNLVAKWGLPKSPSPSFTETPWRDSDRNEVIKP
ncbi:MAG: D-alanyl-D-alanine carboxypeptidase [Pseudanabaena sp.]|jgi:D-alanyl-D-alanine carboxypeptidase/D-alanyl-D-alanine-endopeptidase (penicillin-binding protein 4)|uniref:D-alanyl-D-alanine carboxypeptidase n=1 Tax=Pseudanabaena mucicola TaxID=71190 RepID=UPI002575B0E2|nr:D-alanyl-D-alanine carboxypeptidase [Pseudanabaena mucicola]MCE2976572.1 D-alanyl-D-alanine carboxypeptidase [Pseudanabaena sp. CoA8_M7]